MNNFCFNESMINGRMGKLFLDGQVKAYFGGWVNAFLDEWVNAC